PARASCGRADGAHAERSRGRHGHHRDGPMTEAITARGLTFRYPHGAANALDGIDLDIAAGERVALLGPNGSGKTTFALHLNGLLPMQTGTLTVHGVSVTDPNLREVRRRVGL